MMPDFIYDFKHSPVSMILTPSLILYQVIVLLTPENIRSGSVDIAGIERISIVIRERLK